ncbi:NAD(P)-dependent oxidoreductase [Chloroflexota bacterium]
MTEKIGFIGLGIMGQHMAKRLLQADIPLVIWNRTRSKTIDLAGAGAEVVDYPRDVAARSYVVITMLSDGPALKAVALGANGVLESIQPESILVDMSTVDPESSSQVARATEMRGAKLLRAPVSGSTGLAAAGKLSIIVSGDKKAYDKCRNFLRVMGQRLFYVGNEEEARYLKLVLNMMVGITSQMLAEALTFGEKAGLDWTKMLEVIANSAVESPVVTSKIEPLRERSFAPAFTVSMMLKDFDLALAAGERLGSPMPTTSLVRQFYGMLKATGRGNLDYSSLLLLMEELGGIEH